MINAVTSFFEVGKLPSEVNSSLIVLIPKTDNPCSVNNYRRISLCNVVYKIISKLLVSKLRTVLHKFISLCQSAFIHNRWIVENQVIVQEMLHSFKARKIKEGLIAIKLDFQKAYDRVNWSFIKVVLIKFGFNDVFVNWIMECITSMSFEVLINGGKSEHFKPERGLRQGDPLSIYIFILRQEFLSRLLEKEFRHHNISGVKASVRGPAIMHVMYADEIILFSKACRRKATTINCREIWCVNLVCFSGVFFSKHCQKQKCREIKQILQMKGLKKDSIYLGAPLFLSKAPLKDFKFLQDRLEARLMGWHSKCLSWVGRSTLIKSVAQAIPTYSMSTFNIPDKICDKLDAATKRFWWRPKKSERRFIAWRAWDKLCQPKCQGGLGFKKAKDVNQALLAKLAWMIASKRDGLCMRILREKYKFRNDWLRKNPSKRASLVWKAIEGAKKIIVEGACYLIGDGASVNAWIDPWIPWVQGFKPKPKDESIIQNPLMVS